MSIGLIPSLAIGICAFGAGELLFGDSKIKDNILEINEVDKTLSEAKEMNIKIEQIKNRIEDEDLVLNITQINNSVTKIINTVDKKRDKFKNMNNFFNYYLPVTYRILCKYDEIEDQRLNSEESKKFMESTKNMISKINQAFKDQLSKLYQTDIIDTDADIKVFDSMLKSDGFDNSTDIKL